MKIATKCSVCDICLSTIEMWFLFQKNGACQTFLGFIVVDYIPHIDAQQNSLFIGIHTMT